MHPLHPRTDPSNAQMLLGRLLPLPSASGQPAQRANCCIRWQLLKRCTVSAFRSLELLSGSFTTQPCRRVDLELRPSSHLPMTSL